MSWRVEAQRRELAGVSLERWASLGDGARIGAHRRLYLVRAGAEPWWAPWRRGASGGRYLWERLSEAGEASARPIAWLRAGGGRWAVICELPDGASQPLTSLLNQPLGPRERRRLLDEIAARLRELAHPPSADELFVAGWAGSYRLVIAGPTRPPRRPERATACWIAALPGSTRPERARLGEQLGLPRALLRRIV